MSRRFMELLLILLGISICLLTGIAGTLVFYVFLGAGLGWVGMLIAVAMAVGVGTVLGSLG